MTRHVLNLHTPPKTLAQQIKDQVDSSLVTAVAEALPFIYITEAEHIADTSLIQKSLNSLTSGGVVELSGGTFVLTAGLTLTLGNVTLRGAGQAATVLVYTANANTHIVDISASRCWVERLSLYGATSPQNGAGQTGNGCGVHIGQTAGSFMDSPGLSEVTILCTPSWGIYLEGVQIIDTSTSSGYQAIVTPRIENCVVGYPNSGGCLYSGSGNVGLELHYFTTVSYSFGTYNNSDVAEARGQVHIENNTQVTIRHPIFQCPPVQAGGVPVSHADTDATVLSIFRCNDAINIEDYYGEGLSNTAPRTHWWFTAAGALDVHFKNGYLKSSKNNEPVRIFHAPASGNVQNCMSWKNLRAWYLADYYDGVGASLGTPGAVAPVPPYRTGDTRAAYWFRDDFLILDDKTGRVSDWDGNPASYVTHIDAPYEVIDCWALNLNTAAMRPVSTPESPTAGYTSVSRPAVRFENLGWLRLRTWASKGTSGVNDFDARMGLVHAYLGGVGTLACISDANTPAYGGGLWLCTEREAGVMRQIPFIRYSTSGYSAPHQGELWYDLSNDYLKVADVGGTYQTYIKRSLGTAAGDLVYYSASDTPVRRAIGSAGQILTVSGGLPVWATPTFTDLATDQIIVTGDADEVQITALAKASQTANIQEWQKSDTTVLASVSPAGYIDAVGYRTPSQNGPLLANNIATKKIQIDCDLLATSTTKTIKPFAMSGSPSVGGNVQAPASSGEMARYFATGRTADVASQKLLNGTTGTGGIYRVSFYLTTTVAGGITSAVKVTLSWNDGAARSIDVPLDGKQAVATLFTQHDLTSTNNFSWGEVTLLSAASQDITFITTGTYVTNPQYTIYSVIEHLGG